MATDNKQTNERRALRRRRRLRQLLGAAVCILVVLGFTSVISGGINVAAKLFDNTEELREYEERLTTLVALDPLPFATLSEADTGTLLTAVIWNTVGTIDQETLERDDAGAMYLPTVDIDKTAQVLYGPTFQFQHATFTSRDLTYTYVPEKEAYLVPITSAITDYYPRAEKVQRKGDEKRVTVGYISTYGEDGGFNPNVTPTPVKYNDYIFAKDKTDGKYYLRAIVASEMKTETVSSSSTPPDLPPEDVLQSIMPESVPGDSSVAESVPPDDSAAPQEDAPQDDAPTA